MAEKRVLRLVIQGRRGLLEDAAGLVGGIGLLAANRLTLGNRSKGGVRAGGIRQHGIVGRHAITGDVRAIDIIDGDVGIERQGRIGRTIGSRIGQRTGRPIVAEERLWAAGGTGYSTADGTPVRYGRGGSLASRWRRGTPPLARAGKNHCCRPSCRRTGRSPAGRRLYPRRPQAGGRLRLRLVIGNDGQGGYPDGIARGPVRITRNREFGTENQTMDRIRRHSRPPTGHLQTRRADRSSWRRGKNGLSNSTRNLTSRNGSVAFAGDAFKSGSAGLLGPRCTLR